MRPGIKSTREKSLFIEARLGDSAELKVLHYLPRSVSGSSDRDVCAAGEIPHSSGAKFFCTRPTTGRKRNGKPRNRGMAGGGGGRIYGPVTAVASHLFKPEKITIRQLTRASQSRDEEAPPADDQRRRGISDGRPRRYVCVASRVRKRSRREC